MYKPKVVFAYVEAGMGHIMPMKSIQSAFEKKYGNYVESITSRFYNETNDKTLKKFEKGYIADVKASNICPVYGFFETSFMHTVAPNALKFFYLYMFKRNAVKKSIAHMQELNGDMIVNTHFSTSLFADMVKGTKPLNVVYNPDVYIQAFYRTQNDLVFISTERGYKDGMRHKKRFNKDNLKYVPFAIREKAYELYDNKEKTKKTLGLDNGKITIVLFEGGYGIGKMGKICKLLAKEDIKLNVIAICGKNEKLYNNLKNLKVNENINFIVEGFCDNSLEYLSCADIFMGKSGASSVAEPTFFGVAEIITRYASIIESGNAKYYIKDVKNAIKISSPKRAIKKVKEFYLHPEELQKLKDNALKVHDLYGSEQTADEMFKLLCTRYPEIKEAYEKDNQKKWQTE